MSLLNSNAQLPSFHNCAKHFKTQCGTYVSKYHVFLMLMLLSSKKQLALKHIDISCSVDRYPWFEVQSETC